MSKLWWSRISNNAYVRGAAGILVTILATNALTSEPRAQLEWHAERVGEDEKVRVTLENFGDISSKNVIIACDCVPSPVIFNPSPRPHRWSNAILVDQPVSVLEIGSLGPDEKVQVSFSAPSPQRVYSVTSDEGGERQVNPTAMRALRQTLYSDILNLILVLFGFLLGAWLIFSAISRTVISLRSDGDALDKHLAPPDPLQRQQEPSVAGQVKEPVKRFEK